MEDGRIDDCQIFSSVEDDPARPSFHGRMNGASGIILQNIYSEMYFEKTLSVRQTQFRTQT